METEDREEELSGKTQRELIHEYLKRLMVIENEMEVLKTDKKELNEQFKDRIDLKTLNQALKVHKIVESVQHKTAYEEILDLLEKELV